MNRELLATVIIAFALFFSFFQSSERVVLNTDQLQTITVVSGDTLWGIADKLTPNELDIRKTIFAVQKLNNLDENATLSPGMKLQVPTVEIINSSGTSNYVAQK